MVTLLPFRASRPRGFLQPPRALNWFRLESEPLAELVKLGRQRKTWRVPTEGVTFYAKVFEPSGPALWVLLKRMLGVDGSQREWRTHCRADARGVPVPTLVSMHMHRPMGRAVFVTEEVPDSRSLSRVWREDVEASSAARHGTVAALARAFGRMFAEAHGAGFIHRDAHPDNILIQADGPGEFRAVFIDVRGARLGRGRVSGKRGARSLAQLDHYFRRRASRSERLRFLKVYLSTNGRLGAEGREWTTAIAQAGIAHARALARQRNRRMNRDGKYFATLDLGNRCRATVVLKLARRHVFPEAAVPDRTAMEWRELLRPVADGALTTLDSLVIEEDSARGLTPRLRWSLGGSPARREFLRCHCLRHRDVPSELLLGYVEHRSRVGLIDRAWLIRPRCVEGRS